MREVVVSAEPRKRTSNWGFGGVPGGSSVARTVARACVAARRDPDALVIIDDPSAAPEEVVRLARQRAEKEPGLRLTVGMWQSPGADARRPYVTAAKAGAQ